MSGGTGAADGLVIAQVTSSLADPLGGAEQYAVALSVWLAENGATVHLYGAGATPRLVAEMTARGVEVRHLSRPRPYRPGEHGTRLTKVLFHVADLFDSARQPASLRRALTGHDVVHVHRWTGLGAAVLVQAGAPVVHTVHDYSVVDTATTSMRGGTAPDRLPLAQRLRGRLIDLTVRRTDVAIFPTRRTRDRHAALGSRLGARRVVIPHGWTLPSPASPARRAQDGRLVVAYMGKLIDDKGVPDLLAAWGDGITGAELVVAGAGALEKDLLEGARRSVLSYRGWLEKQEQAELLAEVDVLVLPSRWPENFPLVVAEALLAGVPVLATTVSAPEILESDVNALIVDPAPDAIRAGVERLAREPELLQSLKMNARTSARQLDMDVHGRAVLQEYRDARERRRSERASTPRSKEVAR